MLSCNYENICSTYVRYSGCPGSKAVKRSLLLFVCKVQDSVDNTVEENSSVFSLIQMHWLPSATACGQ